MTKILQLRMFVTLRIASGFLLLFAGFISSTSGDDTTSSKTPGIANERPSEGTFVETEHGFMVSYEEHIPNTDVTFEMVPLPGGTFLMGSPADEAGRKEDEGPQVRIRVEPFWIGRCEVTWQEYHVYMRLYEPLKKLHELRFQARAGDARAAEIQERTKHLEGLQAYIQLPPDVDAVTCPTPLYEPSFTYEFGDDPEQPAVTMSQFGAKQYTKWLGAITGREYRLPSEAEWEYAARAENSTAYSFGEDVDDLADYAWYVENGNDQTRHVGTKKPNPWGLYDMHGNVAEWVLDEYSADYYATLPEDGVSANEAINWPTKLYPRVIRGGCWFDDAEFCRSAARHQSADEDWTMSDPNLPISPWWFTEFESTGVGMHIMRPLQPMTDAMKNRVWESDIESIERDVKDRLAEGRGVQALATPTLPHALSELEAANEVLEESEKRD